MIRFIRFVFSFFVLFLCMGSAGFAIDFTKALEWMHSKGLTKYDSIVEFRPNDAITRGETAKFVSQYAKVINQAKNNTNCEFNDIAGYDYTLVPHIKESCEYGLLKGSNGSFFPTRNITEAEALTLIMRSVEGLQDETGELRYSEYFRVAQSYGLTEGRSLASVGSTNATRETIGSRFYALGWKLEQGIILRKNTGSTVVQPPSTKVEIMPTPEIVQGEEYSPVDEEGNPKPNFDIDSITFYGYDYISIVVKNSGGAIRFDHLPLSIGCRKEDESGQFLVAGIPLDENNIALEAGGSVELIATMIDPVVRFVGNNEYPSIRGTPLNAISNNIFKDDGLMKCTANVALELQEIGANINYAHIGSRSLSYSAGASSYPYAYNDIGTRDGTIVNEKDIYVRIVDASTGEGQDNDQVLSTIPDLVIAGVDVSPVSVLDRDVTTTNVAIGVTIQNNGGNFLNGETLNKSNVELSVDCSIRYKDSGNLGGSTFISKTLRRDEEMREEFLTQNPDYLSRGGFDLYTKEIAMPNERGIYTVDCDLNSYNYFTESNFDNNGFSFDVEVK